MSKALVIFQPIFTGTSIIQKLPLEAHGGKSVHNI
jgi:hypothetical protein